MRSVLLASLLVLAPTIAFAATPGNTPQSASVNVMPPPGPWHDGLAPDQRMMMAFYAANTTHNGHLTLAQAQAANFKLVVDHFDEIDTGKRGYVTFYDIQAWRLDQFAKHLEKQADKLRAMDQ